MLEDAVHSNGEPLARLENISKRYGLRTALETTSLAVARGEVVALAGENGAGKTTAIRILLGLVRPDAGRVVFDFDRTRVGAVGYLPEESEPFARLTARELLGMACRLAKRDDADLAMTQQLLETCGLIDVADLFAGAFSKGMLRRLGMALALAGNPEFVVLDEPQSGLDPSGRDDLAAVVRGLKDRGCGVLLASHDLAEIATLADRVILLHQGKIVAERLVKDNDPDRYPGLRRWFFDGIGRHAASNVMEAENSRR